MKKTTSEIIQSWIEDRGLNGSKFARMAGVSRAHTHRLLTGKRGITHNIAAEISRGTGIGIIDLLWPEGIPHGAVLFSETSASPENPEHPPLKECNSTGCDTCKCGRHKQANIISDKDTKAASADAEADKGGKIINTPVRKRKHKCSSIPPAGRDGLPAESIANGSLVPTG